MLRQTNVYSDLNSGVRESKSNKKSSCDADRNRKKNKDSDDNQGKMVVLYVQTR